MAKSVLLALMLLVLAIPAMAAKAVSYGGTCAGGGGWLVVVTYDDNGNVTRREGVTCSGTHWVDCCGCPGNRVLLSGTPTATATYQENDTDWWVRFNVDSEGRITDMWGVTTGGVSWGASDNKTILH